MTLTFIGVLLLLIGLPIMLYGRIEAVIGLLIACGLLSGSAALALPALGGSTIPPVHFALLFGAGRIFLPGSGQAPRVRAAIEANWPLLVFTIVGVALAVIGPRLFRGALDVAPLRPLPSAYIYAAEPLRPTPQNLTTAIYLIGTAIVAIVVHVACGGRRGARVLVNAGVVAAWTGIALAVLIAIGHGTALDEVVALVRNGAYAQLDQQYRSFIRLSGLFPEPSSYATYAFGWFCFMVECWIRDVQPRRAGPTALALLATLLASTSSSAYVSLAAYSLFLGMRLLLPGAVRSDKLVAILLTALAGGMMAAIVFFMLPAAGGAFIDMVHYMTVGKSQSYSALQRAFWARKGLEAFTVSHGIGTGPGSFRSSSLATAILGSTGLIGALLVLIHLARVVQPLRRSSYDPVIDEPGGVGVAAGWAALMLLVPYSVNAPSCDLGSDFAIFGAAALALRAASLRARRAPAPAAPAVWHPAVPATGESFR